MNKHFHKAARNSRHHRIGLGDHNGSPFHSPYYAYPLVIFIVSEAPPVYIQQDAPIIWNPRLLQEKYSQLMPPTEVKISANYIGRFREALLTQDN